jgi:hypothetical protein
MIDFLRNFSQGISWVEILVSIFVNIIAIISGIIVVWGKIRRKLRYRIKKKSTELCAFSIGLGKNNPYEAVLEYMGENNKDKIIQYYKSHKGDSEGFLSDREVHAVVKEIEKIIGELRRKNFKEVLIFYAGPVAVALHIGLLFKNFLGKVKFMQADKNKNYQVLLMPNGM